MQKIKRWAALVAAALVLLLAGAGLADTAVQAAPLSISGTRSGTVRVYLSSLGSRTSLTLKLDGNYNAQGSRSLSLHRGDQVQVSFNASSGEVTLTVNGASYGMGRQVALRRTGGSGLRITQARVPTNLYPGDLHLTAVKSGSGYRLYPIVHVYMEDYLAGVLPYEMGNTAPEEALKAQAVAARTYTLGRMDARRSGNYDVVDTTNDQVYNGTPSGTARCTAAVNATGGVVLMNGASFTATYYTASNGGQTEAAANVWGGNAAPYLGNKEDPFDVQNPQSPVRRRTVYRNFDASGQHSGLKSLLRGKAASACSGAVIRTIDAITPHTPKYAGGRLYTRLDFIVTADTPSGSRKLTLTCDIFGELEALLGMGINTGRNELWTVETAGENWVLCARRFGHGVGMSQRGAMQMGTLGYTYDQILGFYYPDSRRVRYTLTGPATGPAGESASDLLPNPPAESTACYATIGPGSGTTILRASASVSGRTLMTLPEGTVVTVLGKSGNWLLARAGEIVGWLPAEAMQVTGTVPASTDRHPTTISRWAQVKGGSLNLRGGASSGARVITVMPDAAVVPVLGLEEGWARVQYAAAAGYAMTDYLTLLDAWPGEEPPPTETTARVTADSGSTVKLRAKPSTKGRVLAEIALGQSVTILEELGDWCRVSAGKTEGYMMSAFLSGHVEATETPPPQPTTTVAPSAGTTPAELAFVSVPSGSVNLRAHARSDAKVLQKLPQGTDVQVTQRGARWCGVMVGGRSGYVMTRYLVFPLDEEDDV